MMKARVSGLNVCWQYVRQGSFVQLYSRLLVLVLAADALQKHDLCTLIEDKCRT